MSRAGSKQREAKRQRNQAKAERRTQRQLEQVAARPDLALLDGRRRNRNEALDADVEAALGQV